MLFYFTCYLLVGICTGCAGWVVLARKDERLLQVSEYWLRSQPWKEALLVFVGIAPFVAVITSLLQSGLWVLVTIAEIALGYLMVTFLLPPQLKNLIAIIAPMILVVIFGALWGFWYI